MLPIPSRAVVQRFGAFYPVTPTAGFWCFTARTRLIGKGRKGSTVVGPALPKYGSKPAGSDQLRTGR